MTLDDTGSCRHGQDEKDYQETKNEEKKAFDSDNEELEADLAEVGLNVEIAYV